MITIGKSIGHKRLTECNNDYTKTGTKASNRMNNNNIACVRGSPMVTMRAFVVLSNGKNRTIVRQIPFKVLPMVPLVMPLVPMVPMLPTYSSK